MLFIYSQMVQEKKKFVLYNISISFEITSKNILSNKKWGNIESLPFIIPPSLTLPQGFNHDPKASPFTINLEIHTSKGKEVQLQADLFQPKGPAKFLKTFMYF